MRCTLILEIVPHHPHPGSLCRAGLVAAVAVVALVGRAPRASEPGGAPLGLELEGTWHVLVHFQDGASSHPDRWQWEDRIWVFAREGVDLMWTDHAIVNFEDNTDRFENLGTNRARRLLGAWEPNDSQQAELALGVSVSSRGTRSMILERVPEGWRSREGGGSASGARAIGYSESWAVEGDPALPVFSMTDALEHAGTSENAGRTTFQTTRAHPLAFEGTYARDGTRRGRFRAVPTRIRLALADGEELEVAPTLDLTPGNRIQVGLRLLFSVVRPAYYMSDRRISVDTTPRGARIEAAYVLLGRQRAYRSGRAPVVLELPSRLVAHPDAIVRVRAFAPGYRRAEVTYDVDECPEELQLDLEPLPNRLRGVGHVYLAGRTGLTLLTEEPPKLATSAGSAGRTLVLAHTALEPELAAHLAALRSPHLERVEALQVGEDLVLDLTLSDARLSFRTFAAYDAARALYSSTVDLSSPGDGAAWMARLGDALDSIRAEDVSDCTRSFESSLRSELDAGALARALSPAQGFIGPMLRAALRRLAEVSPDGDIHLTDGRELRAGEPLELELALSQASLVEGLLALLRALANRLASESADASSTLQGIVAPEMHPDAFAESFARAAASEQACARARGGDAGRVRSRDAAAPPATRP